MGHRKWNSERSYIWTGMVQTATYFINLPIILTILYVLDRTELVLKCVILYNIAMTVLTYKQTDKFKPIKLWYVWVGILLTLTLPNITAHITISVVQGKLISPTTYILDYIGMLWGDILKTAVSMVVSRLQIEATLCGMVYTFSKLTSGNGDVNEEDGDDVRNDNSIFVSKDEDYTHLNVKPKINPKFYETEE